MRLVPCRTKTNNRGYAVVERFTGDTPALVNIHGRPRMVVVGYADLVFSYGSEHGGEAASAVLQCLAAIARMGWGFLAGSIGLVISATWNSTSAS